MNMHDGCYRVLQLSDCHLLAKRSQSFLGLNSFVALNNVLEMVRADIKKHSVDLVVFTGDISQDGSPQSYESFVTAVGDLGVPKLWIPGNHDNLENAHVVLDENGFIAIDYYDLGNWRVIMLNSLCPGEVYGELTSDELESFAAILRKSQEKNLIVFIHHPPVMMQCKWLDHWMLHDPEKFIKLVADAGNVAAVAFGHVHAESNIIKNDIRYMSVPSTSFQFDLNSDDFALDSLMPGFRCFDLSESGEFISKVIRLEYDENMLPDLDRVGY